MGKLTLHARLPCLARVALREASHPSFCMPARQSLRARERRAASHKDYWREHHRM